VSRRNGEYLLGRSGDRRNSDGNGDGRLDWTRNVTASTRYESGRADH